MQQFLSLLSWRLFTVQHVSSVFPPIIRSSMTAVEASGFTFVSWWQSCCPFPDCHHDTKVKPEAGTAVIELLMMGGKRPETCWAVNKRQDNKLEICCIWLVIYLNCILFFLPFISPRSCLYFFFVCVSFFFLFSHSISVQSYSFLLAVAIRTCKSISRRCTSGEAWSTGRCLIWHTTPCRGCDWITLTVVMRRAPGDWSYHDNPHLMTGRQIDVFGYVGGGKRGVRRDRPRRYSNFTCRTAGLFNYPTRGQPASFLLHAS